MVHCAAPRVMPSCLRTPSSWQMCCDQIVQPTLPSAYGQATDECVRKQGDSQLSTHYCAAS